MTTCPTRANLLATLKSQRLMLYAWKASRVDAGLGPHSELEKCIADTDAALSAPLPTPKLDARHTQWRVRVRLYRAGQDTPEADTDPDRPADAPGATVLAGLPAVVEHLRTLAMGWHGSLSSTLTGLELEPLTRKLKSLRTTLGRRGDGTAVWRVPYRVFIQQRIGTSDSVAYPIDWLARVDVVREVTP